MNSEFIDEYDYENVQRKLMNSNRHEGYNEGLEDGLNQGMTLGISKGINQGIAQGNIQKAKEIAIKMVNKNIDTKTISEITGLTEEEIEELDGKD